MKSLKLVIENYEFEVPVFFKNNRNWVALKPLCEALGVAANKQWKKVCESEFISHDLMVTTGSDGKQYEMLCIDVDSVGEWIFGINPKKVKPEIQERMYLFRRKLQSVLYAAVTGHIDVNLVQTLVEEIKSLRQTVASQGATIDYLLQKQMHADAINKSEASFAGSRLARCRKLKLVTEVA